MALSDYYLKIGTTKLNDPTPRKFVVSQMYLDTNSERNAKGDLIRNIVNKKYKIELEFPPMKATKMRALLTLLDNPELTVEFYNEETDAYLTKTMYATDLITDPLFKKTGEDVVYDAFPVNLIQY